MHTFFRRWGGATTGICDAFLDPEGRDNPPAPSATNTFYRAASIFTAPILFTVASAMDFLVAGFSLCCAVACACDGQADAADDYFKDSQQAFMTAMVFLLAAFLSPLFNLIDFVGEGVSTLVVSF